MSILMHRHIRPQLGLSPRKSRERLLGTGRRRTRDLVALIEDLENTPMVEVHYPWDCTLPATDFRKAFEYRISQPSTLASLIEQWRDIVSRCDHAIVIAPESDSILASICSSLVSSCQLLNCSNDFISAAGDKWATFLHLQRAGVKQPATMLATSVFDQPTRVDDTFGLVLKPRYGVGCDGVRFFPMWGELLDHLERSALVVNVTEKRRSGCFSRLATGSYSLGEWQSMQCLDHSNSSRKVCSSCDDSEDRKGGRIQIGILRKQWLSIRSPTKELESFCDRILTCLPGKANGWWELILSSTTRVAPRLKLTRDLRLPI